MSSACVVVPLLALLVAAACAPPTVAPTTTPTSDTSAARTTIPSAAVPTAATSSSAPNVWRRITDIPTPRSEVAATVFRGGIFVIGGFGGGRVVERYDPSLDRWTRLTDLPIEVDHATAAAIDQGPESGVYVLGGNTPSPTARVFRLGVGDDAWRELARMPAPRSQAAAVALAGQIYVFGGFDGARLVAPTYAYDVARDAWREVAAIPTPRDHLAGAALLARACAVGGRRLSLTTNLPTLECYDPQRDAWERLPDAPTARGGVGAAAVGDRLVLVGGEQPSGTYREVEAYDAATRRWSRLADLPTPRHGIGVVAIASTIYVMSGGPTPGGSQTPVCEALTMQ
jgi:non-specific serine/threonine protein kinase